MFSTEHKSNMHPRGGAWRYRNNEVRVNIATDKEYNIHAASGIIPSMYSCSIIMTYRTMHRNSWLYDVAPLKSHSERVNFEVHDNGRWKRI